jgi:hypothetical protein
MLTFNNKNTAVNELEIKIRHQFDAIVREFLKLIFADPSSLSFGPQSKQVEN